MIHSFEGDALVVPADRPKQVTGHVRVDGITGKLLGARAFIDVAHTDPTDLRVSLVREGGAEAAIINRSEHPNGAYSIPKSLLADGDPNGHWTLKVADLVAGDGGRVSWRVELDVTDGDFFIELDLARELRETSVYRAAFDQAALRWAEVIVGALGARTLPNGRLVENLLIFASAPPIDGPGQILGQAGPTHVRHDSLLPIAGVMRFDVADLARMADDGSLFDVILHEMGHVLGIGTLWAEMGLVQGAGTSNPVFVGDRARQEYAAWLDDGNVNGNVPIENTGGSGTREAHWRESVMDLEVMTGWIGRGFNPLSRITAASLGDQGYDVNMDAADIFDRPRVAAVRGINRRRRCGCTRFVPMKVAA